MTPHEIAGCVAAVVLLGIVAGLGWGVHKINRTAKRKQRHRR